MPTDPSNKINVKSRCQPNQPQSVPPKLSMSLQRTLFSLLLTRTIQSMKNSRKPKESPIMGVSLTEARINQY